MVIHLNSGNFDQEVLRADIPVLVDFWAPWCAPCKMMGPILESLAKEYAGRLKVGKVNVDEEGDLAGQFDVSGIPMFIVFQNGQIVETFTGALPARALAIKVAPYLN
ncbi:MAG: thioredoxin [Desulfobulbaceae bacterium]|nr:thioredoxin [Desulfobulbaceae bacterium]